jgi:hypothetical protein
VNYKAEKETHKVVAPSRGGFRIDESARLKVCEPRNPEKSEHWVERFDYKETGPQLLLQAFLQRIIYSEGSGGRIDLEHGLGRKRTNLLLTWNYPSRVRRIALDLKVGCGASEALIHEGLEQTVGYTDRCGADEGRLVIFDRTPNRTWEEKIFHRDEVHARQTIQVWEM